MNKIKVHYIDTPIFLVNGKKYYMESRRIKTFTEIDSLINTQINKANEFGFKIELALMNITNMHFGKPIEIYSKDDNREMEYGGMMRYKFFKSDNNHLPIPYQEDEVAFYSNGIQISKSEYQDKIINKRFIKTNK